MCFITDLVVVLVGGETENGAEPLNRERLPASPAAEGEPHVGAHPVKLSGKLGLSEALPVVSS
jgi:hypothetical protein